MIAPKRVATILLTFKRAAHNSLGPLCFPGCPVAIQALQYGFMFVRMIFRKYVQRCSLRTQTYFRSSFPAIGKNRITLNCAKCRGSRNQFGICLLLTSDQYFAWRRRARNTSDKLYDQNTGRYLHVDSFCLYILLLKIANCKKHFLFFYVFILLIIYNAFNVYLYLYIIFMQCQLEDISLLATLNNVYVVVVVVVTAG